jgi:hypothetical protein
VRGTTPGLNDTIPLGLKTTLLVAGEARTALFH